MTTGIVGHCNLVVPHNDRDTSIKQVGLEVISGEFELSAGFIGGMFGLGKDFATRLVNFEARTDLPSHLVYATRKNTYMGSGSKRRHNPYTNSSSPSRSAKSSSRTGGKYIVEKDTLLFSDPGIYDCRDHLGLR